MPRPDITLTAHQEDALAWLVMQLCDEKASLVALLGHAGTGKTFLMSALRQSLEARGKTVAIGAPTHRAALVLRQKGIADATTVHSLALVPRFTADYTACLRWLDEDVPTIALDQDDVAHEAIDGLPYLVYRAVQKDVQRGRGVRALRRTYTVKKVLGSIGIHGRDYFLGFRARAGLGILILDEASMVGRKLLALCQDAFPQVCLVGDPGQLPPVKDESMLARVSGFTLNEVHRQAAGSPILQLATRARAGEPFWLEALDAGEAIQRCLSAPAAAFLTAPLIVWRNSTRVECTQAIRATLGYPATMLQVGEPLVCRSTSPEDRADGFINNALYAITAVEGDTTRRLTVCDALGESLEVDNAHIEDWDGAAIAPTAIPFRLGYAITAHTAQGGEWETVYISLPDLIKYAGFALHTHREEEIAQWCYTAVTRAKTQLRFLTQHRFDAEETIMPPKSPMLTSTLTDLSQLAQVVPPPDRDILDDIPDPQMPTSVQAALAVPAPVIADMLPTTMRDDAVLHAFCQRLQAWMTEHHTYSGNFMDATVNACKRWMETMIERQTHQDGVLAQTVAQGFAQGLQVTGSPYAVTVQALSPAGYVVQFRVEQPTASQLIDEVERLTGWLAAQHYTAMPNAVAF